MRVYWICPERVQEMMSLAEVALQAQEQGGYDPLTGNYLKPYTETYRYTVSSSDEQSSGDGACSSGDRPAEQAETDSSLL